MKLHDWRLYIDLPAGHLGSYDCWECFVCGASDSYDLDLTSAPYPQAPPLGGAILPGAVMPLSDDCEVAQKQIEAFQMGRQFALSLKRTRGRPAMIEPTPSPDPAVATLQRIGFRVGAQFPHVEFGTYFLKDKHPNCEVARGA